MALAARPLQSERTASRDVRHPYALVDRQILWDRRRASPCQIVGCCHQQAAGLAEGPQLHGTVGERAQAKRDIDALPHEVDALIREAEVDPNIGVAILKGKDQSADVQDPESRRAGDP